MTGPRAPARKCAVALVAAIGGCGEVPTIGPPEILYGTDACDRCLMIISDARYAAGAVVDAGGRLEPRRFDDIGCLLALDRDEPGTVRAAFVRDYGGERWLELDEAVYLHSQALHSPMAFGVAAFAARETADDVREAHPGDVLDVRALRERFAQGALRISPGGET